MEIVGFGVRLILSPIAMHLMKTLVGHFPKCMVHYKQFKGLNVGEQAFDLVFIGMDNLNIFTFVSKFWDGTEW